VEVGVVGLFLGIDIGTSGTKAIVVDEAGVVRGTGAVEYPLYTPKPNWAEQDPEDWWKGTVGSTRKAVEAAGADGKDIAGIGFSGQMHGAVLLDSADSVLRPAILWCDQRTAAECDEITERIGARRLLELTYNKALAGFTAPKILWVRNHEPEIYQNIRKVLLPKDYIRLRMTGEYATEVSDASGTLLFDVKNRTWSQEMLDDLEIPRDWMPDCYESPVVSGRVNASAAEELGIRPGVPVVGGGGDNAAGAVGNGIVRSGLTWVTVGTSGVVFAHMDEVDLDEEGRLHTFCHAVPGKWHVMGVTLSAGGSLQWFRNVLCQAERSVAELMGRDVYELITAEAATAPILSEGLCFLPYLTGERTPYPDANARGVFFGLSLRHTKAHMARAVLEGVAFSLSDCLDLVKLLIPDVSEIRASGGGARSDFWRQILADVFNTRMTTTNATEGPAYGAALLAAVGVGHYDSVESACDQCVRLVSRLDPIESNVKRYAEAKPLFRSLYPALKPSFDMAAGLV
jgi:xylulokinase